MLQHSYFLAIHPELTVRLVGLVQASGAAKTWSSVVQASRWGHLIQAHSSSD